MPDDQPSPEPAFTKETSAGSPPAGSLVRAAARWRDAFLELAAEYRDAGEDRYAPALADFAAFLAQLEREGSEAGKGGNRVPQSHFWLLDADEHILACSRLRHRLVESLEREGGHIGYDVRPSVRNRGVGTRLLARTLEEAKRLGLTRVLVTCDADNLASVRVIQKNGGVETTASTSEDTGVRVRRFWIDLS